MPPRGLTPAQEKEIIENYRDPKIGVDRVAYKAGISRVTLYKVLHRTGTPLRGHSQKKPRRVPGAKRAAIEKRRAETHDLIAIGFTPKDIAIELRVSLSTVHKDLQKSKREE